MVGEGGAEIRKDVTFVSRKVSWTSWRKAAAFVQVASPVSLMGMMGARGSRCAAAEAFACWVIWRPLLQNESPSEFVRLLFGAQKSAPQC